jgi:signal transduction histidine kinase
MTDPPQPQGRPATLGPQQVVEVAEIVAHEINNLLNNILLHVAVLDRKVPEPIRAELAVIRQAGTRAGSLLNRWQQMSPRPPSNLQPLDLNKGVGEFVASWQPPPPLASALPVRFEPGGKLPPVAADPDDLSRLVHLLLLHAAAASPPGSVVVRTGRENNEVFLSVEDAGPALDPGLLDRLFEPFVVARPGPDVVSDPELELGLAMCRKLVRRQQGTIRAENRPEGGVRVVVTFRPAKAV